MKIIDIIIEDTKSLKEISNLDLRDEFFIPLYLHLYSQIDSKVNKYPHINFDSQKNFLSEILSHLSNLQIRVLRSLGHSNFTLAEWNKAPENKAMQVFLWNFPKFANLLSNIHLLAQTTIKSTNLYLGSTINSSNFINAKQFIDKINKERWTRPQTTSEQQSGVSNLGSTSELLLETALTHLIDGINFFKNTNQQVQSYGDFVLMCLPNNLWISVKSNFARERFLASGFTTDILGVGFFTEKDEFTSLSKIRNYQRVGFLAIYLPYVSVSEEQKLANTNTYEEVISHYKSNKIALPLNINGSNFLRPLSLIHSDLLKILSILDLKNRTTLII
jgi:hypothetical protein